MSRENKARLALRMGPDTRRKIDQWYQAAGCGSRNQFVERAVNFYVDHLPVQDDSGTLPRALLSSLDGRLGMFEDRMSSLLYKYAVELDIVMGILADNYELTEEEMRHRRADSVRNVKYTATRDRVELVPDGRATKKQEQLISNLAKDFPDAKKLPEYDSYRDSPTKVNASVFITRALEDNWSDVQQSDIYAEYIATRPRNEKMCGRISSR